MSQEKKSYLFHCTICGTPFRPTMPHARTCSNHCRAVLHGFSKRGLPEIPVDERTPIDKEAVAEKYKTASGGKEMPKGILDQYPSKVEEKKESVAGKLLGKRAPARELEKSGGSAEKEEGETSEKGSKKSGKSAGQKEGGKKDGKK